MGLAKAEDSIRELQNHAMDERTAIPEVLSLSAVETSPPNRARRRTDRSWRSMGSTGNEICM
jgi:hypothetical protein